jgi:Leucine-rich repeat (LRR) protein
MAAMVESHGTVLNLWKKDLGHVPDYVWERTDLEVLILADNALSEISERIRNLSSLRTLDLGHNQITWLPESLGEITGLSDFLYLHDNRLSSLPSSIAFLKKLRYLNLSENAFSILPLPICGLSGLIELQIS